MIEVTSYLIWEYLRDGKHVKELFEFTPVEHHVWIKNKLGNIKYNFFYLQLFCNKIFEYFKYGGYFEDVDKKTKDEFIEHISQNYEEDLHPILISIWDGDTNKFNNLTWGYIKPKFDKPKT